MTSDTVSGGSSLPSILSLFFRLRERRGSPCGDNAPGTLPALAEIEHELQTITDRAEASLRELAGGVSAGVRSGPSGRREPRDPRELLRREREKARRAMEQDIVRLHRQLGTGIAPDRMESLARILEAHGAPASDLPRTRFRDRIEIHVLRYLYLRAGEEAWKRLQNLLARSGLSWPPSGQSAANKPEEFQRQREAHIEKVRESFLEMSPFAAASLIHGDVEAWRYGYPARNSYLWLQTALRGVAAALRAEAFAVAAESWLWRPPDLEGEILKCVSEKLTHAQGILEHGVGNAAEAGEVVARVDEVCDTVIPGIVWNHAAKRLQTGSWRNILEQAPATSTEPVRTDPVCGMSFPEQKAAEQLERAGGVFYFCSTSCRRKFEERHAPGGPVG